MPTVISKYDPSEQRVVPSEQKRELFNRLYDELHKKIKQKGFFPGNFVLLMNVFDDTTEGKLRYMGLGGLEKMMGKTCSEMPEVKKGLEFLKIASVSADTAIVSSKVYRNFKKEELHRVGGKLQDYFKGVDPNNPNDPILEELSIRQRKGELPVLNAIFDINNSAYVSVPLIYSGKKQNRLAGVIHIVYDLTNLSSVPDPSLQSNIIRLSNLCTDTLESIFQGSEQKKYPSFFS